MQSTRSEVKNFLIDTQRKRGWHSFREGLAGHPIRLYDFSHGRKTVKG
jgi:hypothetical protein